MFLRCPKIRDVPKHANRWFWDHRPQCKKNVKTIPPRSGNEIQKKCKKHVPPRSNLYPKSRLCKEMQLKIQRMRTKKSGPAAEGRRPTLCGRAAGGRPRHFSILNCISLQNPDLGYKLVLGIHFFAFFSYSVGTHFVWDTNWTWGYK